MTYSTKMTSKGQVTIPVAIRRNLGLKAGESVQFKYQKRGNQVIIEKNDWKQDLSKLQTEVAAHLKKNHIAPLNDEELDEAINQSAEQGAAEHYKQSLTDNPNE